MDEFDELGLPATRAHDHIWVHLTPPFQGIGDYKRRCKVCGLVVNDSQDSEDAPLSDELLARFAERAEAAYGIHADGVSIDTAYPDLAHDYHCDVTALLAEVERLRSSRRTCYRCGRETPKQGRCPECDVWVCDACYVRHLQTGHPELVKDL